MKFWFSTLVLLAAAGTTLAQDKSESLSTSQQQCYVELSRAINPYANPNFFYQKKLNLGKASQFKKAGLDLNLMSRRGGAYSPLENVLLSDYVIRGLVTGAEELRESGNDFEMVYQIKVINEITGETLPKTITVKTRPQLTGFGFFSKSQALQLGIGEEVLLYLEKVAINPKSGEPKKQFRYEQISISRQENNSEFVLVPTARLRVEKGQAMDDYNRPLFQVKRFKKSARKVMKINDAEKFYSRNYCR